MRPFSSKSDSNAFAKDTSLTMLYPRLTSGNDSYASIGETGIIKPGRGIVHFPHRYFVFTFYVRQLQANHATKRSRTAKPPVY